MKRLLDKPLFQKDGSGAKDIKEGFVNISLPLFLAQADIRQRYRRSTLGPFWITISTGVMITCIGVLFSTLFKSPVKEFLPFLAAGIIIWNYISTVLIEATTTFISAEAIIKQLPLSLFMHVERMVARNLYIFFHNIIIFPLVCLVVQREIGLSLLWFVPGLILITLNLLWMSLIISVVCTRFRDMGQIVQSFLQIIFYVTPIIWLPSLLKGKAEMMVLDPNPFYHFLEITRAPLMNYSPSASNWLFSLIFCIVGWFFAIEIFNRYRNRIAYWL